MNLREEFIKSVCEDAPDTFLRYMELHGSKNEPFDVKELLQTLQRKDHERLWAGLRDMTHRLILNSLAGNQENDSMQTDTEPLTTEWPILQSFLKGITTVALCAIATPENTIHISPAMLETVAVLHGLLIALPEGAETLQNNIAQVCESWFLNELDGKEELLTHTMPYLIIRSLARGTVSDVKRVWSLRQSLLLMDYQDNSSESLRQLLHQCMIHPMYLKMEEGRRFLSFLFGLNPDLSKELHKTIKNQIPSCAINILSLYGEVYFRAWRVASGPYLKVLEETCVQDLMFCAVHAQRTGTRSMASRIRKVLEYFHQQKKLRGVDEALVRLYQPIIWRAFKVANPMVRANAAALLTDAFPLQDPDTGNEEIDSIMQKQFDILQELLGDRCPTVRATAVHGVCRITGVFWELIPAHIIKAFVTKLVNELAFDTAASAVRLAVFQGLKFLLDNRLSHPLLKSLLGNLKDLIHDSSEKVRIAFLDVLVTVKGMKAIKYWNIVPLDQLLSQLEVEPSSSVTRRLVKLLFNSFHPTNKEADVVMARCASLWQASSLAARKFYQYVHLHTTVSATGKFIILLGQCLLKCAQNARVDNTSSSEEVNALVGGKENVESMENVDLLDVRVLNGMAETVAICWGGIRDQLDKRCNEGTKTKLVAKFTKSLPKMFGAFKDPRIQAACIVIAGFLPQSSLPAFSDDCMSSLSSLSVGSASGEYGPLLNCLCAWGRVLEVLELINEWISSRLRSTKQHHEGKTTRQKKKSVTFQLHPKQKPSLALDFLAWLMGEPVCRTAVQGHSDKLRQIADTLKTVMAVVELKLSSSGGRQSSLSQSDEEFFKKAFRAYCLSEIHLHHLEKDETNAGATAAMEYVIVWADRVLLTSLDCDLPASSCDTSGTSKQTQEEDNTYSHLICNFIEMILSSLSEMIMLNIAEEKFYSHVAVFTTSLAKLGEKAGPFLPQLSKLLYQITHSALLREDPGNLNLLEGPVSVILTSLLQILTSCATTDDLSQAFFVVRSSLAEVFLLTEVGRRRTGAAATLMAPLVRAIISDIKEKPSPAEDETDVLELPRLATFFVKIVSSSQALVRSFVHELERFVLSGELGKAIKSMLAAVVLLQALEGKAGKSSIKACAVHIEKQLKNLDHNNVVEEGVELNTAAVLFLRSFCADFRLSTETSLPFYSPSGCVGKS